MKNLILLILQGIPASGKSSWARNFIKHNSKEWVIVNRDSIRSMLGNYWVPSRENLVSDIEKACVDFAIEKGFNIIVDATNLNPKTIKMFEKIAEFYNMQFEDEELKIHIEVQTKKFEVPLKTAIWRDFWRGFRGGRSVGKKVITNFYNKYYGEKK